MAIFRARNFMPIMLFSIGGCASINSTVYKQNGQEVKSLASAPIQDGLIYYMPKRGFKITVSVDSTGKIETSTVTQADTIPDYTNRFVLRYQRNWVGTNHGVLGVNSRGLLETSSTTSTSSTATIATALGTLAGAVAGMMAVKPDGNQTPPKLTSCTSINQVYNLIIYPEDFKPGSTISLCDFTITGAIAPSGLDLSTLGADSAHLSVNTPQSGIFYKRDLPYIIKVTDKNSISSAWLLYSPDQSPVSYFPLPKGAFAAAASTLTISDGALSNADISTDSEVSGFLQIPANILTGYFQAIGSMFNSRASVVAAQTTLATNQQSLAVAQAQREACRQAMNANPINSSMSSDVIQAAINSIKSAC